MNALKLRKHLRPLINNKLVFKFGDMDGDGDDTNILRPGTFEIILMQEFVFDVSVCDCGDMI